ncbi:DUF1349 domain-containing protein [Bacillus mangrovi]|uniref:DUF1349 domain-containing protein n=1 Tax=Metabacillus mangrovi TaxID=1491830 RepID=A0A7X2S7L6_9BACI|nr:DUF1349 domain-containing protein [Metabacillus mangrovi]MTH54965.1 DUF1349 domain-containing protein [Metabacillus mangrovi]
MNRDWIVNEKFTGPTFNEQLEWLNEPEEWGLDAELILRTDEKTDFWQNTHYGFTADNGHFLSLKTDKNFRMTTKVEASPHSRYDQAGLMIRFSEQTWVKASVEYIPDGPSKLGAVVTNRGYSDWSTQYISFNERPTYFRASRIGQNCYIDISQNGEAWEQIRIAHLDLPEQAVLSAGVYACSPQGKGQHVCFEFFTIEELSDNPGEAYL